MQEKEYQALEIAICTVREKMIKHAEKNGFLDEGTIKLSQRLDQLIIQQLHLKFQSKKIGSYIQKPQYTKISSSITDSIIA